MQGGLQQTVVRIESMVGIGVRGGGSRRSGRPPV